MTVYNVEKALFIYKSVTKTQKSAAANLNLELKYVFFVIFLCAVDTQASLKKKRKLKLCSSRASVVVATMRTSCIQNWIIVEFQRPTKKKILQLQLNNPLSITNQLLLSISNHRMIEFQSC